MKGVRRLQPAVAVGLLTLGLLAPAIVVAVDGEITSEGPLTRIIITPDLNCQVAHQDDVSFEFFGGESGACGTFLSLGDTLYGPASVPSATLPGVVAWTPVSQSPTSGSGSGGDPFRIATSVQAADSGIRIDQTDSYRLGEESYRTDVRITNSGGTEQRAILYRAGDCYLQDSDAGFGRVDQRAPACVISLARDARIEQWLPLTAGSRYFEGEYSDVWERVSSQQSFPDQCLCDQAVDNGAGLSWEVTVPAGASVDVSHLTFFSPEGLQAGTTFRDAVPGPGDINLDPVVIASSAAIAAGVVLFVPFPAALFNSTLEENYAEVMATVGRFRAWFGQLFAGLLARGRRAVSDTRARRAGAEHAHAAPASSPTSEIATTGGGAGTRFRLDEAFWKSPLGILVFLLVSALLYGLLDPTFGIDNVSLATFLGLALGMGAMLLAFGVPMFIGGRGHGLSARALPGTLLVAAGCVLISRLADFQPGYLYGLIIGFTFARPLAKAEAGKLDAVAAACALGLAIMSWILLPVVRGAAEAGDQAFTAAMLETAFATVVVAGLEAAAIAMVPMRFLPGERVRSWSQRAWAALLGVAAFGFCHLLLNPSSGYLADTSQTSLFTVIWLLVAFGGGSVLFWAYFRFRPSRAQQEASPPSP
ncbi:MAG TPA: FGLLP motif-containing membrane protein [Candidatus Limnocylindria bacterium]|nr:FGLLP motif-containing membrane protein [Candidatus Limnocylindria bacterium]